MDRERTLRRSRPPTTDEAAADPAGHESSLLEAARGWAGSARDALERLQTDDARTFLETARRNGPGQ